MEPGKKVMPEWEMTPDERLDTKNAAIYVGFSSGAMANMRSSGGGPKYVDLGKIFYFKKDLDEWIKNGMRRSTFQADEE